MTAVAKRGRPTLYTPELALEIAERLSMGEPLAHICLDAHMPAVRTVSLWKATYADFSAAFARARDDGFDRIAAECLEIADDKSRDTNAKGGLNKEFAERSKIRIDTRLKLLARWDPKRYGERMQVDARVEHDLVALIAAGRARIRSGE